MSNIGHNIKACRERVNMTQQQLALKVRVGTGTIAKYENGDQIPDTQTVLKISTALDIPASELLEQELQKGQSGIDYEIEQLVREIGTKKAKLILRKAKEFSEEDFLRVMQMLYEIKYDQKVL
ncbi:helix-turn-helix domain-containing protein [Bacillus sp. CMF12]|uniref:helix-turn-helix domain-containing protein n=1 Tax=Bacillaceae TaxID=186817 RepID=UPI001C8DD740|nr:MULTISPECIES: helix-turn-helix transcriptional regulator [Bacillaceae]MDM5228685.1 helix-turn-helix transcriptional regulator [Cytobacillus sp. NJ13]MBX9974115.1 helix-turn-helix transcriptional regulator [Cytobacillus firmus]MDF2037387.1 helix-turn-helix transcriptional regulator [Cytobacillus oceanisediminis]UOE54823.1 helix-turn-helix transcriptional regulator [Cytobacillus oceanisediminis]USK49328.1 helix-turn-helix domain-containing protein [Bacillus sp. CMF12]